MIQVNVGVIRIDAIQNFIIFAPKFFNFKIIISPRIFENDVASRVLNFTYSCTMPLYSYFCEIRRSPYGFEDVEVPHLWYYSSTGSRWIYTDAVIINIPESSTLHFRMTLQTA